MIEIESNIKITKQSEYHEYIDAMISMKKGDSFLVDNYKIVDAVRAYAHNKGFKVTYRTIHETGKQKQFRIWKLK
tara:strand:- start:1768 stop:1992 length:225 start_codon:yes stop_codon:yes gene_type:complete